MADIPAVVKIVERCQALFDDPSFNAVKQWKAAEPGRRAIGYMPVYVPRELVHAAGMLPVGLAYGTSETEALAKRMGLPLIAKFRAAYEPVNSSPAAAEPARQAEPAASSVQREPILSAPPPGSVQGAQHHAGSVRSGQQVYARDRDLIVTGAIANGAEVIADGNIHIYGGLRGRAMAGAQGDQKARIFVSDFRAELVAIAGQYRVFEQIPDNLEGQSVQCWLDGEKLMIAKL